MNTHRPRWFCLPAAVWFIAGLPAACLHAQDGIDFSEAFGKLQALGLPDLKGAVWVKESGQGGNDGSFNGDMGDYYSRQAFSSLNGNVWQLADGKQVVSLGSARARAPAGKVAKKKGGGLLSALGNAFSGKSSKLDPKEDAASLISFLSDSSNTRQLGENGPFLGKVMLFAAQLHAAGHTDEANRLASAVLAIPPEPSIAVDGAVSAMAADQQATVLAAFYADQDWGALQRGLAAVAEKFPRGWNGRAAALALAEQAGKRKTGAPALPAPLEPVPAEISAQILAWVDGKEASEETDDAISYTSWLLPAAPAEGGADNSDGAESEEIVPAFLKSGRPALAALIPLLKDATLTPRALDGSGAETVPATRAQHAAALIRQVLPGLGSDEDADPEESMRLRMMAQINGEVTREETPDPARQMAMLHGQAIAFWNEYRTMSPVELAVLYLKKGTGYQKQQAGQVLARSTEAAAEEAFTAWATAEGSAMRNLQLSKTWIETRKAAAAPFVEKLAAALRKEAAAGGEQPEEEEEEYEYNERRQLTPDQAEQVIASLKLMASDAGLVGALRSIATGEADAAPALESMQEDLAVKPIGEVLPGILEAAVAATPANRPAFLNLATDFAVVTFQNARREGDGANESFSKVLTTPVKAHLIALLEKPEPIPLEKRSRYRTESTDVSAAFIEMLLSDAEEFSKVRDYFKITGKPAGTMMKERSLARLKGTEVPAWPDAEKVKGSRVDEIIGALEGKPAADALKLLEALQPDEQAAVSKWLGGAGKSKLPAVVKELALTITATGTRNVYASAPPASAEQVPGLAAGMVLNEEALNRVAAELAGKAAELSPAMLTLHPGGPLGLGWVARAELPPADETKRAGWLKQWNRTLGMARDEFDADPEVSAVVTFHTNADGESCTTHWLVGKDGKVTSKEREGSEGPAAAGLRKLAESTDNDERQSSFLINILTRKDLQSLPEEE